ncbi:MAG: hypothetical protein WCV50_02110 [Patescibacteria group bacterium]|jgi:hypothetical protein
MARFTAGQDVQYPASIIAGEEKPQMRKGKIEFVGGNMLSIIDVETGVSALRFFAVDGTIIVPVMKPKE